MGIAAPSLGGRGVGLREKSEVRNGSNSTACLVPAFEFGKSVPHSGNDNKSQKTMGKLFNRRHAFVLLIAKTLRNPSTNPVTDELSLIQYD